MPVWTVASVLYFAYLALVALGRRGMTRRNRGRAMAACAGGVALAVAGAAASPFWLRFVLLPPAVLVVAYWTSGLLWVRPMPRVERVLLAADSTLRIPALAARMPRAVVEVFELGYAAIYPLIPIALAIHLTHAATPDPDRFWTVVLVTDFACFGMLPWIQTRPPRVLDPAPPWRSTFRRLNVRLLGETSIGVNTVPSGHAAEAVAAALLVSGGPWPIVTGMWLAAAAVSGGAVFGRYHFAVDALAGWAVALGVWLLAK